MNNKQIDAIKNLLDTLEDIEREELIKNYCSGCGSKDRGCQCDNDE